LHKKIIVESPKKQQLVLPNVFLVHHNKLFGQSKLIKQSYHLLEIRSKTVDQTRIKKAAARAAFDDT
jgi:hypothetical protein